MTGVGVRLKHNPSLFYHNHKIKPVGKIKTEAHALIKTALPTLNYSIMSPFRLFCKWCCVYISVSNCKLLVNNISSHKY